MAHKLTTCTFCGVGCGLYMETAGGRMVGAYPSMSHPANRGRICVRGWHVHEVAGSPDRLTRPLVREGGRLREASWDEAASLVAARLREIRDRHGLDALAFLCSPRCSNEESYLLQKFARSVIGTNNVDHGTGVYTNNSVNALLKTLGVPASTNSIAELATSEVILVDGVDLARQLPTVGGTVIRAKLAGAKLVVIDARRHRVAESADLFLQIKPGTEALLYGAMAKVIADRGLANLPFIKSRCDGYEVYAARLAEHDLLGAAEACGVPAESIEAAAVAYARARSAAILYSTGIEGRTAETVEALADLALLTGHLGREGSGIYALTEHNNLQGVCDMGMMPDRLPGYVAVDSEGGRGRLEAAWNARLPSTPGAATRSLLRDRADGRIRAVWLCRYDPVSTAFFGEAARSLDECDFVVVQHLFLTETAKHAHVVLPTTAFGEEEVTFTNTERRIQLATRVTNPLEGTTPAWQQIAEVARALGADWRYASAAEVMDEIGAVVPAYSGASHENLARDYGRQWPCTKDRPLGTRFLFSDPVESGRFHFVPLERRAQACVTTAEYPLTLVFGHSAYYWHNNVLIQHSETLKREYRILLLDYPEGFVEMHPEDARALSLRDGERIRLVTAGGTATSTARLTGEVRQGTLFVPYFVREVQNQVRYQNGQGPTLVPVRVEKEAA